MQRYFPLGSGFATYGTDSAVKYYSKLYVKYGFRYVYGLNPSNPMFAHDTYWPAIMAQFGLVGLIAMIILIWKLCMDMMQRTNGDRYSNWIILFVYITQVTFSIATATFFHFVTVSLFFIVPLAFPNEKEEKIMRILILRTTPNIMNLKNYNLQEFGLAKALIRKGHQCDVGYYCGKEHDHVQEILFDGNEILKVLWLHGFGAMYEGIYPSLGKYAKNYDIIQVGGYVGLTSCWLNIFAKNKIVNYNGLYYCEDNTGDIKKAKLFDKTLLNLQNKKNMVVATKSVLATNYLKDKGIENVTTIGVGLDLDNLVRSADEIQTNEFTDTVKNSVFSKKLLYIGVLEERRNIPFLLETFKKVSEKIPNAGLILIGKGRSEYISMCLKKIEELGIKDKVIYKESLEQKYMPAVYQACDAFLLPTRYEIFGMVILEAMYYGLPVFTTYNGGSSTLMNEKNGVVIDSLDVNEWSEKIIQILADKNKCREIGENAHKTIVEGYTWDALADKFLKVYEKRLRGTNE